MLSRCRRLNACRLRPTYSPYCKNSEGISRGGVDHPSGQGPCSGSLQRLLPTEVDELAITLLGSPTPSVDAFCQVWPWRWGLSPSRSKPEGLNSTAEAPMPRAGAPAQGRPDLRGGHRCGPTAATARESGGCASPGADGRAVRPSGSTQHERNAVRSMPTGLQMNVILRGPCDRPLLALTLDDFPSSGSDQPGSRFHGAA